MGKVVYGEVKERKSGATNEVGKSDLCLSTYQSRDADCVSVFRSIKPASGRLLVFIYRTSRKPLAKTYSLWQHQTLVCSDLLRVTGNVNPVRSELSMLYTFLIFVHYFNFITLYV